MHVSACCAHMCLTLACVNIPKPAKYEVAEREMDAIKHRVEEWGRGVVRGGKKGEGLCIPEDCRRYRPEY